MESSAARFFPPLSALANTSASMGVFHQMGPPRTPSPLTQLMHPVRTFGASCCCGARDAIGTRQMLAVPKLVSPFWMARREQRFS